MLFSKVDTFNDFSKAEKKTATNHRKGNDGTTCN